MFSIPVEKRQVMNSSSSPSKPNSLKDKLDLRFIFKLFLVSIFPTHFWTSLMIFNDLEFVAERTDSWDSIGYAGYSLLFALAESLILSIILWMVSLVFPQKWQENRILSVLGSIYLVLAGASIIDMSAHAFSDFRFSKQYLYGLENFTNLTIALIVGAILVAMTIAMLLIFKTKKGEKIFSDFFDRIMVLSYFYLILDFAGLVVVIVRNFF
jgi:hypothetical protein